MAFSKRISVFIFSCTVAFLFLNVFMLTAATVNEITATSVSPEAEPGWKGKISVAFTGAFNASAVLSTSSGDSGLQILDSRVVSSQPSANGEFSVIIELTVATGIKLKQGKIPFTIMDDTLNRVKGFIKINGFSCRIIKMDPEKAVQGERYDYILGTSPDLPPNGTIIESMATPGGTVVSNASIEASNIIKAIVKIDDNAGGRNLSLYFTVGTPNDYRTFAGVNLLPITYDNIKIEDVKPDQAVQGAQKVALKIKGKNFAKGLEVQFSDPGIETGPVNVLSSTTAETEISVTMKAKPGPVNIGIQYKKMRDIGYGMFKVLEAVKPVITKIEPSKVHAQPESIFLKINGEGFDENTTFSIGGKGITILGQNIINPKEARVEIRVTKSADEGMRSVTATKYDSLKFSRPNSLFVEILRPYVEMLTPNYAEADTKSCEITANGGNFEQGMKIRFQSPAVTLRQLDVLSNNSFRMLIDIADNVNEGYETFFLTNPDFDSVAIPEKLRIIRKQYDYKIALSYPGINCTNIKDGPSSGLGVAASNYKISNLYPVFKWTSNAKSFNFGLYTAIRGQKEIGEVISNRPMYYQENIKANNLTYPLKARELRPGKRYFWKVEAVFKDKKIQSEVWCFEIQETITQ